MLFIRHTIRGLMSASLYILFTFHRLYDDTPGNSFFQISFSVRANFHRKIIIIIPWTESRDLYYENKTCKLKRIVKCR